MQKITVRRKKGERCTTEMMPRVLKKINETYEQSRVLRLKTEYHLFMRLKT